MREIVLASLGALAGWFIGWLMAMTVNRRELGALRRTARLMKRAQRPWRRCIGCTGYECEHECAYPNSMLAEGRAHP